MTKEISCDVLVVGGGPGGYPAAIRAGQLGLKTVLVEADRLGGTCLIRGCIPSKAIIHAASEFDHAKAASEGQSPFGMTISAKPELDFITLNDWKSGIVNGLSSGVAGLLKGAKVEVINGWASFTNAKTCTVTTDDETVIIKPTNVVLANGSTETELPGIKTDGTHILSSRHALDLTKQPKSIGVIGAGYIGLELGIALNKLGTDVSFFEAGNSILPGYDSELTRPVQAYLDRRKIAVHTGARAKSADIKDDQVHLIVESAAGESETHVFDKLLIAIGRQPVTSGWGLETMGVDMNGKFVAIDSQCRTSMSGVYAIGDLVGEPMLAHKATAQGECVAEIIAGQKRAFTPVAIPAVCFTEPEIVSVGLSPDQAEAAGEETIVGRVPFAASGKAMAMNAAKTRGFVRITARKSDHVVLGIQAVGAHVSELSGEFVLALEMGAVLEDIAHTIHAHPTLSEALNESALAALGHPIHIKAG